MAMARARGKMDTWWAQGGVGRKGHTGMHSHAHSRKLCLTIASVCEAGVNGGMGGGMA